MVCAISNRVNRMPAKNMIVIFCSSISVENIDTFSDGGKIIAAFFIPNIYAARRLFRIIYEFIGVLCKRNPAEVHTALAFFHFLRTLDKNRTERKSWM